MPHSLRVQGLDALGLDGASMLLQGSSSSTPHPSGYIATVETVLPVRETTNTAGPWQSCSALSGVVGNNSRKHWYSLRTSKGMPSSLIGETGKYFNTAPQTKKTQEKLALLNPIREELSVPYMGSEDLLGFTRSEHLFFLHVPLIILTGRNGI